MISAALSDISAAIDLEPLYVDAYWQRHLVNVSLNRPQQAIDDLNLLLQLKQDHVSALKSRLVQYNTIQGVGIYCENLHAEKNAFVVFPRLKNFLLCWMLCPVLIFQWLIVFKSHHVKWFAHVVEC